MSNPAILLVIVLLAGCEYTPVDPDIPLAPAHRDLNPDDPQWQHRCRVDPRYPQCEYLRSPP
jgi:hypothetical protein